MNPRPPQTAAAHTQRRQPGGCSGLTVAAHRNATVVGGAVAVTSGWMHRHELGAGCHLLDHLSWWWRVAGSVVEGASPAPVGLLQRRLLRAGDVNISAVDVTKISLAANAISVSRPGIPVTRSEKTGAGITNEIGSPMREYQLRQRLLPDMEFKAVPLMVPAPGTPKQTPTRVFDE